MRENDRPVLLLIGERGTGKSSLINDRLKTTCGGDIRDVFHISINSNRFARLRSTSFRRVTSVERQRTKRSTRNWSNICNGNIRISTRRKEIERCSVSSTISTWPKCVQRTISSLSLITAGDFRRSIEMKISRWRSSFIGMCRDRASRSQSR